MGRTPLCPLNGMDRCRASCMWNMSVKEGENEGRVACAMALLASVVANGKSYNGIWCLNSPREVGADGDADS